MEFHDNKVVALVVTYNRKKLLKECLNTILLQDYPIQKIIIIDNASTDGTDKLFSEKGPLASKPGIEYHRMGANLGGAGGFKKGIQIAAGYACDWIWLMDDDCIAQNNTLGKLVEATNITGNSVSFLASRVFGPDREPMNVPSIAKSLAPNGYADWYRYLDSGLVEIETATFVSLLINCAAVKKIGLPIGNFFIWGDDTEYTNRLTRFYGPAYFVGGSSILHKRLNAKALDIRFEDNPIRLKNYRFHTRNVLIVHKYYGKRFDCSKQVLRNLRSAFVFFFRSNGKLSVRWQRLSSLLLGTYDFISHRYKIEDLEKSLS